MNDERMKRSSKTNDQDNYNLQWFYPSYQLHQTAMYPIPQSIPSFTFSMRENKNEEQPFKSFTIESILRRPHPNHYVTPNNSYCINTNCFGMTQYTPYFCYGGYWTSPFSHNFTGRIKWFGRFLLENRLTGLKKFSHKTEGKFTINNFLSGQRNNRKWTLNFFAKLNKLTQVYYV